MRHNGRHMMIAILPRRLGFFTRLLDQADPAERYRLATAQIIHAERLGFDSAWIAFPRRSSSWPRWPRKRRAFVSGRGS
jgi:hypothetical protein